jgi:signal transduction histidine kinase
MNMLVRGLRLLSVAMTATLSFEDTDTAAAARGAVRRLARAIAQEGAEIEIGALPPTRIGSAHLAEIFARLFENALHYRRPGAAPRVRVEGRLRPDGLVAIEIADNGTGFDERHAELVFAAFKRLHPGLDLPAGIGAGVGLPVCRRLAERYGGSLDCRSVPGAGSVFTLALPAAQTPPRR